ncbi:MAG: hypothetical protein FWH37_08335 [Candidatus Bathyarchaeota archaeon]|nr:hypothetical protein [Candidatus Termiticorpusculum sp.]
MIEAYWDIKRQIEMLVPRITTLFSLSTKKVKLKYSADEMVDVKQNNCKRVINE